VVDELGCEDADDRQGELRESVNRAAIRISSELTEVRQPGVGPFHRPSQSHGEALLGSGLAPLLAPGDDRVVEVPLFETLPGGVGVIAPIEPEGLDVGKEPPGSRSKSQSVRLVTVWPSMPVR